MCGVWHPSHSSKVPVKCLCLQTKQGQASIGPITQRPSQTDQIPSSISSFSLFAGTEIIQTQVIFISETHAHANTWSCLLPSSISKYKHRKYYIVALTDIFLTCFSHFSQIQSQLLLFFGPICAPVTKKESNKKFFQSTFFSGMMFYVINDRAWLHAQCNLALHTNSL